MSRKSTRMELSAVTEVDAPYENGVIVSAPKAARSEPKAVTLPPMQIELMEITIVGDSPLLCHAWSKKAKEQMLAKQMKEAKQAKEAKDPEQDYQESLYHLEGGGYGFPAGALKGAAVDACSHVEGVTKVEARGAFHVMGSMVQIHGTPRMHEAMVRIMGTADIRYRAEFPEWSCQLRIRFNKRVLSAEQIVNLFNVAGFAIGIGDWRPQKDGSMGMFHVA